MASIDPPVPRQRTDLCFTLSLFFIIIIIFISCIFCSLCFGPRVDADLLNVFRMCSGRRRILCREVLSIFHTERCVRGKFLCPNKAVCTGQFQAIGELIQELYLRSPSSSFSIEVILPWPIVNRASISLDSRDYCTGRSPRLPVP